LRDFLANKRISDLLLDHVPAALALFDTEMCYLGCSRRWREDYGLDDQQVVGKSHYEVFPEISAEWRGIHRRALAGESFSNEGEPFPRADGSVDWVQWEITPWHEADGRIGGLILFAEKLTEKVEHVRIEAEHADYLRSILETVPDAMITIDEQGIVLSFSKAAERMFGYDADEVIGQNVKMLMPEDEAVQHDGYLAHYRLTRERRIIGNARRVFGRRKDGSCFPHELFVGEANGGGRRTFTGFLRDLTAREDADARLSELQAELVHIARISAVGTMATALAHELNQPLHAIANYVQSSAALLAREEERSLDLVQGALEEAGREALRAGGIVQRLREFVARGELEHTIALPRDLAAEARDLGIAGSAVREIECDVRVPKGLQPVLVDRVQIQQVLLNLIRNAVEAIGTRGTIMIDARQEGTLMRFSVTDTGIGIEPGMEERVFEPFISTKASGMGMGLAICRTIIEAHGGTMWCEQAPSGGAAFYFTVPVVESDND